jgi:DNA polymerase III subunit epsilon
MKLIYIDVETTGIPCPQSGLVQLAGLVEDDGKIRESFDYRIGLFPADIVSDEALAVNGLTREEIAEFNRPERVFSKFIQLLDGFVDRYNRTDKLQFIGYNATFDADHVRAWFEKNNDKYYGSWFWHPPIDVMGIAAVALMKSRAELRNFKLGTVAQALGLEVDDTKTHDALYDVHLTREMFHVLLGRLK